jgi:hypothetical protein
VACNCVTLLSTATNQHTLPIDHYTFTKLTEAK